MTDETLDTDLEAILEYLKRRRGFDFTGYKRATLQRRIAKRIQVLGIEDTASYLDYLEVHPEEFSPLFNTILINVTDFFRDPPAWELLMDDVLPRVVGGKREGQPIRIWSAGCASGEEAYSLAMAFAQVMGVDRFMDRVKIYATDIDEDALTRARHATYTEREIEQVPEALRSVYFERVDGHYTFRKDMRRQVIFGRHDLIQDAPISRIDFLACRNTLMYFNAEVQTKIIARFHFALNDNGILFLGRAETLLTHHTAFAPIDLKRRISAKVPGTGTRDQLLITAPGRDDDAMGTSASSLRTMESAFDASPVAQIVVDQDGVLLLANERTRSTFGITAIQVGRPLQDVTLSYKPLELRSRLDQVFAERRVVAVKGVEWMMPPGSEERFFDVYFHPLADAAGRILGATVSFFDVSTAKRLQRELERSNQELETAYEELQSTNEELETTNEELQSTVEELETTNEELQSTNEELETMNEELRSTNEELQTINEELRTRSDELNDVNAFLESILRSLHGAVVVVDRELRVLVWNERAEDLWGLRRDEVEGKHFLNLDIGLPVEQLRQPLRAALGRSDGRRETVLDAINRRGKTIQCRIDCMPLVSPRSEVRGVIMMMDAEHNGPAGGRSARQDGDASTN
jgi:two-component system, chemotaxis family, CheB/CheR fusion protein